MQVDMVKYPKEAKMVLLGTQPKCRRMYGWKCQNKIQFMYVDDQRDNGMQQ